MRDLRIEVGEGIVQADVVIFLCGIIDSKHRLRKHINPASPHGHIERGLSLDYRPFELRSSVEKADGKCTVILVWVTVLGGDIDYG